MHAFVSVSFDTLVHQTLIYGETLYTGFDYPKEVFCYMHQARAKLHGTGKNQ